MAEGSSSEKGAFYVTPWMFLIYLHVQSNCCRRNITFVAMKCKKKKPTIFHFHCMENSSMNSFQNISFCVQDFDFREKYLMTFLTPITD